MPNLDTIPNSGNNVYGMRTAFKTVAFYDRMSGASSFMFNGLERDFLNYQTTLSRVLYVGKASF